MVYTGVDILNSFVTPGFPVLSVLGIPGSFVEKNGL